MQLTSQQLTTLKGDINSNAALAALRAAQDWVGVAAYYNTAGTFIVWRTSVTVAEMQAVYSWAEIVALAQGQFNALSLMQNQGVLNPSLSNVRSGMSTIMSVTAPNTLTALTTLAKRAATNGERLFATGTGTSGSPGSLVVEGAFTDRDINLALNS